MLAAVLTLMLNRFRPFPLQRLPLPALRQVFSTIYYLQAAFNKWHIGHVSISHLASNLFPAGLLVVHDAVRGGQHNDAELHTAK